MPRLVQFGALTLAHFLDSPVWASSHSFDYDEPWYAETDEETFRPWDGPLPVSPNDGMYLVRANFVLADGTPLEGFVTPPTAYVGGERVLGEIQPQIFLPSGEPIAFWLGMFAQPALACEQLYASLGKNADAVFPISFAVSRDLARDMTPVEIRGFYLVPDGRTVRVVR
ncbi:MAG TPA: hypothetical protein VK617_01225 [Gemmatimonadaceae bacterium]|nr:hypothetical protein [Gemmatimonadaceae bacterium]